MFTGIVEEMGEIVSCIIEGNTAKLTVRAGIVHAGTQLGDSIAINGCCLTVVTLAGNELTFDAIPETLSRTNLGALVPGSPVNLERSLEVGARLGGHFVQGHIDGVGSVVSLTPAENAVVVEISIPSRLHRYFVEKGSIAVDGVSLTVVDVNPDSFTVWTIPHTRAVTTLGIRNVGDVVNIECDMLGKYVERLIAEPNHK